MVTRDDKVVSTMTSRETRGDLYILFDVEFPKHLPGGTLEIEGSYFGTAYRGLNQPKPKPAKDINVTVDVTLEEVYNGSRKEVTYLK